MKAKTVEERLGEIKTMYVRLGSIGISRGNTPELFKFFDAANAFVRDGTPDSGFIRLPQVERRLVYRFSHTRPSQAIIEYTGSEKER